MRRRLGATLLASGLVSVVVLVGAAWLGCADDAPRFHEALFLALTVASVGFVMRAA